MPQYRVHYIAGPNENLTISRHQIIEAASFQEALGRVTQWPVVETYDHTSACAKNPGKPCRWKKTKPEKTPGGARVSVSTRPRRRRYSPHGAANGLHSLVRRQYGGIQH